LASTIGRVQSTNFDEVPEDGGRVRTLPVVPDTIQHYGLDLKSALSPKGFGLVWAALADGDPIAKAPHYGKKDVAHASFLQVTNLRISVKDSPQNTLVLVTRLD